MNRLSFLPALLLGLALTLSLTACDSSNDDDDDGGGGGGGGNFGSYSATLGGDLSGSISGNAFFSVVTDEDLPGGKAFVLWLIDGTLSGTTTTGEYIYFARYSDRPGTGSHPIGQDVEEGGDVAVGYFNLQNQSAGVMLAGESGTLTLTTSSPDRVARPFTFTGTGLAMRNQQAPQQITGSINGTLDAVFVNPNTVPPGDL